MGKLKRYKRKPGETDRNELTYKIEIAPQTLKTNLWFPKGKHEGSGGR